MTPFPPRSYWRGKMLACFIAVALIGSNAWSAQAEVYPDRTIKIVSPHPAGVATDVLGRAIAPVLQQNFGQPVVLENRPGANGIVAEGVVARSTPDGYTILITSGAHIANAFVAKELPFEVIKDFAPVTELAASYGLALVTFRRKNHVSERVVNAAPKAKPAGVAGGGD